MKIKSLLLGSAAASMLAVSGAQAADPIIYAEPEPMEYVRICDVYGAGYYYIPGTETCLRISGFARYQMNYNNRTQHWGTLPAGADAMGANRADYRWWKLARFAPSFDVRTSTEWGTVRAYAEVEFDYNSASWTAAGAQVNQSGVWRTPAAGYLLGGATTVNLAHAFIDIGDADFLRIGRAWGGYGAWIGGGTTISDGDYGLQRAMQVTYAFNASNGAGIGGGVGFSGFASIRDSEDGLFQPDVEAGLGYGWGPTGASNWVRFAVGYDNSARGWGAKGGVRATFDPVILAATVLYSSASTGASNYTLNGVTATDNWSVIGAAQFRAADDLTIDATAQWYNLGTNHWTGALGLSWTPVSGLRIRPEVTYTDVRAAGARDIWGAVLRFDRSF